MQRPALILLPCLAIAPALLAQPAPPPDTPPAIDTAPDTDYWTIAGYWDNDGGILKRNNIADRHYTNGFGFTFAHHPDWADWLSGKLPWGGFDRTAGGYMVGQQMFTPEDISTTAVINDDRPYAGYLWIGAYLQRSEGHEESSRLATLEHFQVDAGVMGDWSQADALQDEIHNLTDGVRPQGWSHQIGEQVTFQTWYRRKWRLDLDPIEIGDTVIESQVIPQAGVALGTLHCHLEGSALFRVGVNLPDDFGPGRLTDVASATGAPNRGFYLYGFGRVGGRAVLHDATLEGNPWSDDPHTVDEEPFIGEVGTGLALGYAWNRWAAEVSYSQTYVSKAYKAQDGSDGYGSLALSVTGKF